MNFEVRTDSLAETATALGWARGHTVVIDRPADGGGQDLGFNGGELLHLAIAGCVSNDLFREARTLGLRLTRVAITARGEFSG
ncbi:MAG TPA: OsmC family peroxiredoxin, partial [Myxococcaceae bacterium]